MELTGVNDVYASLAALVVPCSVIVTAALVLICWGRAGPRLLTPAYLPEPRLARPNTPSPPIAGSPQIQVKHFHDDVEVTDGQRLWIEPIGLTQDLCEWCCVHGVLTTLGPPRDLWEWFEEQPHADAYDDFLQRYHEHLACGPHSDMLMELARRATRAPLTLLHQGDDPRHNTAAALYEFLARLQAHCSRNVD